ncbi:hypothetical protein FRC09_002674 [Ceratobasidium sp. 395]|nr:hypothetical protein FRC09_002674 [Ceratobasidium sp. 395]
MRLLASGGYLEPTQNLLDLDLLQHFYGADGDIPHTPITAEVSGGGQTEDDSLFQLPSSQLDDVDSNENDTKDFSHLPEAELDTLSFICKQLASQQKDHFCHPPVKVPCYHNPCPSPDSKNDFWSALKEACEDGCIPHGCSVLWDEWDEGTYPKVETIRLGRRKGGEMEVALPNSVLFPRAVRWAQALHVMSFVVKEHKSSPVAESIAPAISINPMHWNYTHPEDKVFQVLVGNKVFPVHQHPLARVSSPFQGMVGPRLVSGNTSTKDMPVPEGSSSECPLPLELHGTKEEWNMLFEHMYVAHYGTKPWDLTRSENISLLSISHKCHIKIKGAIHKAKVALEALGLLPPLQLNLGCKFCFQDWVNCTASLIF